MAVSEVTKYLVFLTLNIVVAFCGAILLAFGAILQVDEHKGVRSFAQLSIGGFGIGIGVLGLCLATWGIWALFKRKPSILTYYAVTILVLFIVQIVLGAIALGSVSGGRREDDEIEKDVQRLFRRQDDVAVKRINHIQKTFRCCGVNGPNYWKQMFNKPVPMSCCPEMRERCDNPYEKGCARVYAAAIEKNVGVIGGVAIGFSPVLLVSGVLAWYIRLEIKKMQYTVCGITLIAVGAVITANESKGLDSFTDFSVGGFAIAVGVIIFIIAFFGCCGAIKENGCMLTTYAVILIVLLILQIVLGAMAFVAVKNDDGSLDKEVKKVVTKTFDDYVKDPTEDKKKVIDAIQQDFKCCGVDNWSYWTSKLTEPPSSCYEDEDVQPSKIFKDGCAKRFQEVITYNIKVIGGIALGFAVVELVCAIFAFIVKNRS